MLEESITFTIIKSTYIFDALIMIKPSFYVIEYEENNLHD